MIARIENPSMLIIEKNLQIMDTFGTYSPLSFVERLSSFGGFLFCFVLFCFVFCISECALSEVYKGTSLLRGCPLSEFLYQRFHCNIHTWLIWYFFWNEADQDPNSFN